MLLLSFKLQAASVSGYKWGNQTLGTGANVTYSYMSGGQGCDHGRTCSSLASFMTDGFESEVKRAFETWSAAANINFELVADDGADWGSSTNSGDIRIAGHTFERADETSALAHAYFPISPYWSGAGDIHFNVTKNWTIGSAGGYDIFFVALHEIGHALGLRHDSSTLAVMNPYYNANLTALTADDIAGIRQIYGIRALIHAPIPAAFWLFASGLIALVGFRKKQSVSV